MPETICTDFLRNHGYAILGVNSFTPNYAKAFSSNDRKTLEWSYEGTNQYENPTLQFNGSGGQLSLLCFSVKSFNFEPRLIGFVFYISSNAYPIPLSNYQDSSYNIYYASCTTNFLDTNFKTGGIGIFHSGSATPYTKKSSDGKTIYWYAVRSSSDASYYQFNSSDCTYFYYAIG